MESVHLLYGVFFFFFFFFPFLLVYMYPTPIIGRKAFAPWPGTQVSLPWALNMVYECSCPPWFCLLILYCPHHNCICNISHGWNLDCPFLPVLYLLTELLFFTARRRAALRSALWWHWLAKSKKKRNFVHFAADGKEVRLQTHWVSLRDVTRI